MVDRSTSHAAGINACMIHSYYDEVAARLNVDGWIVGRKTMEDFAKGSPQTARSTAGNLRETHSPTTTGVTLPSPSTRTASSIRSFARITAHILMP